jgi:membrane protein DedA with SNARE-associated domain
MLAGMARMPFWRFQVFSAAGASSGWPRDCTGYALGSNLGSSARWARSASEESFIAVILSVLVVAQERATRRR